MNEISEASLLNFQESSKKYFNPSDFQISFIHNSDTMSNIPLSALPSAEDFSFNISPDDFLPDDPENNKILKNSTPSIITSAAAPSEVFIDNQNKNVDENNQLKEIGRGEERNDFKPIIEIEQGIVNEFMAQFSSDTIAHLIDVIQDHEPTQQQSQQLQQLQPQPINQVNSSVDCNSQNINPQNVKKNNNKKNHTKPFHDEKIGFQSLSQSSYSSNDAHSNISSQFIPFQNSIKTTNSKSSRIESENENENKKQYFENQNLIEITSVESETIQESESEIYRRHHHHHHHPHKTSVEKKELKKNQKIDVEMNSEYEMVSKFSIGIPKEIMKVNKRKPHLKRINPTYIGPISQTTTNLWGSSS